MTCLTDASAGTTANDEEVRAERARVQHALAEPDRLAALHDTGLLDSLPEEAYERLTRLATRVLNAPVALVSLVDADRQFFKSQVGLAEPWASARQTPLSHSFCQYVAADGEPLIVSDARQDPLLRDNLAIPEMGVVAYCGFPIRLPDGPVLGSLCAIDGQPRQWSAEEIATVHDLAACVATEITLGQNMRRAERERAMLAAITGSMVEGLVVLDDQSGLMYRNDQASELIGVEPGTLRGEPAVAIFQAIAGRLRNAHAVWAAWEAALTHIEETPCIELEIAEPSARLVLLQLFPVNGADGKRLGVGIMLRDVTAERELERTKDEVVSMVSHELRAPLASLVGFAELLLTREFSPEDQRKFLGIIEQEGKRLSTITDDFLDLQRLKSGRQELHRMPLPPRALLAEAVEAAGLDAEHPISVDAAPNLPLVDADPDRFRQVLLNLLSNARKYSPTGGAIVLAARPVTAPSGADAAENALVRFSVRDHGLGIPADALPRLFQPFYRIDGRERKQIKGTGLGLSICQEIVMAHGGTIWVESDGPDTGTTMCFTVPVNKSS